MCACNSAYVIISICFLNKFHCKKICFAKIWYLLLYTCLLLQYTCLNQIFRKVAFFDMQQSFLWNLTERSRRKAIWNCGVNAGKNDRFVHTRASTCNHRPRKPLCFSNSEFDSRINSPSVHNSFTATRPRRRFWMQNLRESKQSAGGDVCAVRFNNNPRALFWRVLSAVFSPPFYSMPLLPLYICIYVYICACAYRAYRKLCNNFGFLCKFDANLSQIYYKYIIYLIVIKCYKTIFVNKKYAELVYFSIF